MLSDNKVFIIAEAGVNHNGSLEIAKKMIDEAVKCGADAVKFQSFTSEKIVSSSAAKAEYQMRATNACETQLDMLKRLELSFEEQVELKKYCEEKGIMFLSSPFDIESIDFLNNIDVDAYKVPSGEITNLPYLRKLGASGKKIILSTGMSTMEEVISAVDVLQENGTDKKGITVLHCTTDYPAKLEEVNLRVIPLMRDKLGVAVGYSDHTLGITASLGAVAMGAVVIEKHFTLDRNMEGPDHKASLDAIQFREMVIAIRDMEKAMGLGEKAPSPSERENMLLVRKSIVAKKDIKKGESFSENNLAVKRPGTGLNPMKWDEVIGKSAKKDYTKDEFIGTD